METVKEMSFVEYQQAVTRLSAAASAYYDTDTLLMDDAAYDELLQRVADAEKRNPAWGFSGLADSVAGGQSRGGDVAHSTPMLSLDNAYSDEELDAWFERLRRQVGNEAEIALCVEPKLDGLALACRYESGRLSKVITRGDGTTGEDVTARARHAVGLPSLLPQPLTIEVRGECVMTDAQFEEANRLRTGEGKPAFANPRNAVAGCIRRQHSTWEAPMTFAAYGVATDGSSHTNDMEQLAALGFQTALDLARQFGAGRVTTIEQARDVCHLIASRRAEMVCGIDGAVVKADDQTVRENAGATGKSPRWAIARKFPPDTRLTKLLDIECDLGRTGALTVRAVLDPVSVGGVVIRYCTLSNPAEIARKDLRIGDMVWVRRAGEVIPEITGVDLSQRIDGRSPWEAPQTCPRCDSELERTQKVWRCPNGRMCGLTEAIEYAVGRDALDVEGLGEKLVRQLVDAQLVADVADLFSLSLEQLAACDRMGETSAQNVLEQLEKAKHLPLSRVLTALGIRLTGRRMCRRIAKTFQTMDALRDATAQELACVDGVGDVKAETIANELIELGPVIDRLKLAGVNMTEPAVQAAADRSPLSGKKVCVTGSIPGHTRDSAQLLVEQLGGTAVSSVTAKTDLLVVGDGGGSKARKAEQLGVKTITAEEFLSLSQA